MTAPISLPDWLVPASCEIGLKRQVVQHRSGLSGVFQSVELGAEYWVMNISTPPRVRGSSGRDEAFFNRLIGGAQPVELWHFARPEPAGTMRGSPVVNATVTQFSHTINITTTGTLLAGDMFGIGSQLFQVADASLVGSVLTVTTVNRSRVQIAAGTPVVWYRPKASFVMVEDASAFVHRAGSMSGSSFSFVEAV